MRRPGLILWAALGLCAAAPGAAAAASPAGNYDASGRFGEALSLQLVAGRTHRAAALRDVVIVARQSCRENGKPQPPRLAAFLFPGTIRPRGDGGFSAAGHASAVGGRLLGRLRGAAIQASFREHSAVTLPAGLFGTGPIHFVCDVVMAAGGHLTPRIAVRDGPWVGRASDGESVHFAVHAGGRLLQGASGRPEDQLDPARQPFTFGTWLTSCSGPQCSSTGDSRCAYQTQARNALIAASGTVDTSAFKSGSDPAFTLTFGAPRSASGSWSPSPPDAHGQSCRETWTASPAR